VAAVARSLTTGVAARSARLREVSWGSDRPESALLHARAAETLVLATRPLGERHEPRPVGRIVAAGREER
jgi:hypothetical protein